MNGLLDDLDLDNTNPDDVERGIAMAGAIPEGKYHARLAEATGIEQAGSYNVVRLKFQVLTAPYAGKLIEETLFLEGSDDEKTQKAKQRRMLFMHRLGLLRKVEQHSRKRYVPVEGKHGFTDCLGQECVIAVKVRDETYTPRGKTEKVTFKKNVLEYEGVFELIDPKVKDVKRGSSTGHAAPSMPAAPRPIAEQLAGI